MDFLPFRETLFRAGVFALFLLRDLRYAMYFLVAADPLVSFLGRLTALEPLAETFLLGAAFEAFLTYRLFGVLGTVFDFRIGEAFCDRRFRTGEDFLRLASATADETVVTGAFILILKKI